MKLYGLFVVSAAATAENSVGKDPRHHSFLSQIWTSFTDTVSDLFDFSGISEVGLEALFRSPDKNIRDVLTMIHSL